VKEEIEKGKEDGEKEKRRERRDKKKDGEWRRRIWEVVDKRKEKGVREKE
jgi:hypothetical protein